VAAVVLAVLLAAHVAYWYVPRERPVVPRLGPAERAARRGIGSQPAGRAAGADGGTSGEPLRVLAAGAYHVCLWVPYPHQNLGALAAAIGDLQDVVGAAVRLTSGEAAEGSAPRTREPEEPPTFGPFEVPPASEMVACSDLAGGRLKVVARIYPALAVVAKLAGRIAGNPWLAGGAAGSTRIAWEGRLWTVTAGPETPVLPAAAALAPAAATAAMAPAEAAAAPAAPAVPAMPAASAVDAMAPELPESLAVVHWTGARPEIPAGYYALTRSGSDLALSLISGGGGAAGSTAALPGGSGALPSLLVAVGPDWRGAGPFGGGPAGSGPADGGPAGGDQGGVEPSRGGGTASNPVRGAVAGDQAGAVPIAAAAARPPAALALFEAGGSRLSSLGDLPGLAVFNAAAPGPAGAAGAPRWHLPTEGLFRMLAGRLPAAEVAGWRILALDQGSLRQAAALAPRLAALMPPVPAGTAMPAGGAALSLGLWIEPRSTLRIVSRIRQFVEKFPLASRRQVELWRDWEIVLDPLANCEHAALTATPSPPSMRLLLRGCTAAGPR
jgi:hypothetical protein